MNQSRRFLGGEGWEAAAAVKPGDRVLLEGLGWATVRLIDHGYQMLDVQVGSSPHGRSLPLGERHLN